MIFDLYTAGHTYDEEDKNKLELLGFEFTEVDSEHKLYEKMEQFGDCKIEINSLSELMEFIDEFGSLVIDKDTIWIYDGYME